MASNKPPAQIAKETLIKLAAARLPPTPDHYTRQYCELAGIPEPVPPRLQRLLDLGWGDLLRRLIAAWELPHRDWTTEMKRHSLERVLATKNPERLFERLDRLVEAWKRAPTETAEEEAPLAADERSVAPFSSSEKSSSGIEPPLPRPSTTSDQEALIAELRHLLAVLLQNIELLVPDEHWVRGQVALLAEWLRNEDASDQLALLREAEGRIADILERQQQIVAARREAETQLKALLAHFLDEMAAVTSLSGEYQQALEQAADTIEAAREITEVTPLLRALVDQTRTMHERIAQSHHELTQAKAQAEAANARIQALEAQLAELSAQVSSDPLTGLLNRRGFQATFEREQQRIKRHPAPLALAILDLDNFKKLNDTLGHQAGDEALKYLATMARTHLRAQDVVGRYGGEEFVVLLPDTDAETAAEVIRRLQRALTRDLFFVDERHLVITFSAGVTQVAAAETLDQAIARADAALYEAKRAGKNRVFVRLP